MSTVYVETLKAINTIPSKTDFSTDDIIEKIGGDVDRSAVNSNLADLCAKNCIKRTTKGKYHRKNVKDIFTQIPANTHKAGRGIPVYEVREALKSKKLPNTFTTDDLLVVVNMLFPRENRKTGQFYRPLSALIETGEVVRPNHFNYRRGPAFVREDKHPVTAEKIIKPPEVVKLLDPVVAGSSPAKTTVQAIIDVINAEPWTWVFEIPMIKSALIKKGHSVPTSTIKSTLGKLAERGSLHRKGRGKYVRPDSQPVTFDRGISSRVPRGENLREILQIIENHPELKSFTSQDITNLLNKEIPRKVVRQRTTMLPYFRDMVHDEVLVADELKANHYCRGPKFSGSFLDSLEEEILDPLERIIIPAAVKKQALDRPMSLIDRVAFLEQEVARLSQLVGA